MVAGDPNAFVGSVIDERYVVGPVINARDHCPLYEARDLTTNEAVSLRLFLGPPEGDEKIRRTLQQNFVRAANTMAYLSRLSEAVVHTVGGVEQTTLANGQAIPFAVLEPLNGGSLAWHLVTRYDQGGLGIALDDAIDLLDGPMQVVAHAHDHGIVHRHLEPANLWVFGDELRPGVAIKLMGYSGLPRTASLRVADARIVQEPYNPRYAAPEQFYDDEYAIGPWSDVYAMALILLEIMQGGRPVIDGRDVDEAARQTMNPLRRPTPRQLGIAVTEAIERVFAAAVSVDRLHRFRSLREFRQALLEARVGRTASWTKRAFSAAAKANGQIVVEAKRDATVPARATVTYHGVGEVEVVDRSDRATMPAANHDPRAVTTRRAS